MAVVVSLKVVSLDVVNLPVEVLLAPVALAETDPHPSLGTGVVYRGLNDGQATEVDDPPSEAAGHESGYVLQAAPNRRRPECESISSAVRDASRHRDEGAWRVGGLSCS